MKEASRSELDRDEGPKIYEVVRRGSRGAEVDIPLAASAAHLPSHSHPSHHTSSQSHLHGREGSDNFYLRNSTSHLQDYRPRALSEDHRRAYPRHPPAHSRQQAGEEGGERGVAAMRRT